MRILLTSHLPIAQAGVGRYVGELAAAMQAAGHEVRTVAVGKHHESNGVQTRTITCLDSAELPFDVPWFGIEPEGPTTFESLSTDELHQYRDVLRRVLDEEVEAFDPQVIHAQHVWLWGQLALESGVPYVLTAWGPELVSRARDDRYRPLADQAAENASRIFVPDEHIRKEVLDAFEDATQRTLLMPTLVDSTLVSALIEHYMVVLEDRFGM